jgi:hypothetical protein
MLLEDGDFWNNFKYLPKLQVIAYPLKYDPHAGEPRLPNVLAKRLLVGTWSKNGDHIYAYGHGNGSKHSVINQVSYFRTGKQGFQQVSILAPEIQLRQPFDDLSAQRAETFGTRLRFLVLFYFMEKGFLDRLTVTKEGLSPIQLCCERIAAQSKSAGIQPVRFRRPTRETKKAQKAKVPGKTSTQQPAKNVAASPSATQSAQCVRSVPKDNSVHQGTTPMSRPSGQGCASDGSIPKAHPILGGRYEKSHAAASKVATPTKAPKSSVEKASEHCQNPGPSRQASEIDQDPLTDFKAEPSESSINDGNRPNMKRRSEADPSDTQGVYSQILMIVCCQALTQYAGSSKRHQTDAGVSTRAHIFGTFARIH